MLVVRTVKVPVQHGITKRKLSILDSVTARTTYGVWLWSKLFKEHELKGSCADRRRFYEQVKADAKLGSLATHGHRERKQQPRPLDTRRKRSTRRKPRA